MDKMIAFFDSHGSMMLAVVLAVVAWSFLQAIIKMLTDLFLVKVFKKKLNGNGKNGKRDAQLDELIVLSAERNKQLECLPKMAKQVSDINEIVTEKDGDNFPKMRVMEKKVREIWNKVIRGVD